VLNKIDLAPQVTTTIRDDIDGSRIALSAISGQGMDGLMNILAKWSEQNMVELDFKLPMAKHWRGVMNMGWFYPNKPTMNG